MGNDAFYKGLTTGIEMLRQNRLNKQMETENARQQTMFDKSQAAESTVADLARKLTATEDTTLPFTAGMGPSAAESLNVLRPTGRMSLEDKKKAFIESIGKAPERVNALSALYRLDPDVSKDLAQKELAAKIAEIQTVKTAEEPFEARKARLIAGLRDPLSVKADEMLIPRGGGEPIYKGPQFGKEKTGAPHGVEWFTDPTGKETKAFAYGDSVPSGWKKLGGDTGKDPEKIAVYKYAIETLKKTPAEAEDMAFNLKGKSDADFGAAIYADLIKADPSSPEDAKAAADAAVQFRNTFKNQFVGKERVRVQAVPPVNRLKEGVRTKFKNGEVWTLQGGNPVRVE